MNALDKIVEILKSKTEDNEIIQGDVVSYIPDWEFRDVAEEIVKKISIPDVLNRRELLVDFAMKRNNAPDFVRAQYERDAAEYLSKINGLAMCSGGLRMPKENLNCL